MRSCRHITRDRRGNALVLAVLILLALTSVGVIAVQRTNTDLMSAGNVVRASQACASGEAGMTHGMGRVGQLPNLYITELQSTGDTRRNIEVASFSTAITDPTGVGAPHYLPVAAVTPAAGSLEATERVRQDAAYVVDAYWLNEIKGMAGYDADGSGCMQVFDFNSQGGIPTRAEEDVRNAMGTGTVDRTDSVVVRVRARALAGPIQCQLR